MWGEGDMGQTTSNSQTVGAVQISSGPRAGIVVRVDSANEHVHISIIILQTHRNEQSVFENVMVYSTCADRGSAAYKLKGNCKDDTSWFHTNMEIDILNLTLVHW